MDPVILSHVLSCLGVQAVGMIWIAALAASATVCAMNSFWLIWSLAISFCLAVFM